VSYSTTSHQYGKSMTPAHHLQNYKVTVDLLYVLKLLQVIPYKTVYDMALDIAVREGLA
jgi:hypothetical protein